MSSRSLNKTSDLYVFTDELFLLSKKAKLDFKQLLAIVNEAAKECSSENGVAILVRRKILDRVAKTRKIEK